MEQMETEQEKLKQELQEMEQKSKSLGAGSFFHFASCLGLRTTPHFNLTSPF